MHTTLSHDEITRIATEAAVAAVRAVLSAPVDLTEPAVTQAPAPAPVAPKSERKTKALTRSHLKAIKATKAGAKKYAGVSLAQILAGEAPMPKGYHAPTGARREAIQAWKAAQSA